MGGKLKRTNSSRFVLTRQSLSFLCFRVGDPIDNWRSLRRIVLSRSWIRIIQSDLESWSGSRFLGILISLSDTIIDMNHKGRIGLESRWIQSLQISVIGHVWYQRRPVRDPKRFDCEFHTSPQSLWEDSMGPAYTTVLLGRFHELLNEVILSDNVYNYS